MNMTAAVMAPDAGRMLSRLYHNHGKPINLGRRQFKKQRKDAKAQGKKFLRQCREAGFPRQGGAHA